MQLTSIPSFRPLKNYSRAMAPNFQPDVAPNDTVSLGEGPKINRLQQRRLGMMVALAMLCLPASSAMLPTTPPPPVTHEVPADSWAAGIPGRDPVATRLEGIQLSLETGHLTAKQAGDLRHKLENLPGNPKKLAERLTQFDNSYDSLRLPSDPPDTSKGKKETADPAMVKLNHDSFLIYDSNGDRAITRTELTRALTGVQDGRMGATAAAMAPLFGELSGKLGYITWSSLDNPTLARYTDVSLQRQANQPERKDLSEETFDSSRIRQRFQGSCVLLSTLIDLPARQLREMITDNHDGTFTVRFRNGKQATVKDVTEAERSFFSTTFEGERWPALFEKALGTVRASEGAGGGDIIAAGATIPPSEAMALMTGRTGEFRRISALGPSGLRQFMIEAQRNHEPIIAGISETAGSTGLIGHHEYAVKSFNPLTNMVTLRNPHGSGVWNQSQLNENGLFEMPLKEFYNHYHNITALK